MDFIMWIIFTLAYSFLMALVNYTDERLAVNNKLPKNGDIHSKVGSVLLISTLMSFVGAFLIYFLHRDVSLTLEARNLAIFSAVPMVIVYAVYFYFLQLHPVHMVSPLFLLSTVWLLLFELFTGTAISFIGFVGVAALMYGAYILDAGTYKWKIPTKLLLTVAPATSAWAIALYMVKHASIGNSALAVSFWQLIGIGTIGLILFCVVKKYRGAFIYRVKHQGKRFLGLSFANETFAEAGYAFSTLAVSVAPVATYVSALMGMQSVFLLGLFLFFPYGERVKITPMHWIAVIMMAVGVFLVERG